MGKQTRLSPYDSTIIPLNCNGTQYASNKANKNDILDNKNMLQLLPPLAQERIAEVFTYGSKKYSSWNWANGIEYSRLYGALQRHLTAWYKGEEIDPETGKSHLAHAGCCIMMLLETNELRKDLDDRPKHYRNEVKSKESVG